MKRLKLKFALPFLPFLILLLCFAYAYFSKPFQQEGIFCLLNEKTGIRCPTCGITRAIYSILVGRWGDAFYYHALFTVGFIPLTAILTLWGIRVCLPQARIKNFKFRWIYFYLILAVVLLFTAIRNVTNLIY